jgi:2-polyprenyl-6-hydroxyphenyl methylase/3-demethylubiquinone-9 3-methyltransferase
MRPRLPADNTIYDQPGDIWWDELQPLHALRTLNPVRMRYFRDVLAGQGIDVAGKLVVDVGCGGGLLAEEIARLGVDVIGVDPSPNSIETARRHAASGGLSIDYRIGRGEELPVADSVADIVCCVDVLEHVTDLDSVIAETARVLKPGGLYLFDTINRTLLSRLLMIKLSQEWRATAWMPAGLHDWNQFITPAELSHALATHDLRMQKLAGIAPSIWPPALFLLLRQLRKGTISYAELGDKAAFALTTRLGVSYIGHATRTQGQRQEREGRS